METSTERSITESWSVSESVLLGGHEDFWKRKSGQDIPFLLLELAVFLRLLKLVFFYLCECSRSLGALPGFSQA